MCEVKSYMEVLRLPPYHDMSSLIPNTFSLVFVVSGNTQRTAVATVTLLPELPALRSGIVPQLLKVSFVLSIVAATVADHIVVMAAAPVYANINPVGVVTPLPVLSSSSLIVYLVIYSFKDKQYCPNEIERDRCKRVVGWMLLVFLFVTFSYLLPGTLKRGRTIIMNNVFFISPPLRMTVTSKEFRPTSQSKFLSFRSHFAQYG